MMERALKERIIGAAVLVVFVVLVVPIFLDGPPDEDEIVSRSVPLPGQEEQETKTVVLDRERSVPIPAASTPVEREPEPETVAEKKDPEPQPLVQPARSRILPKVSRPGRNRSQSWKKTPDPAPPADFNDVDDRHVGRSAWQLLEQGQCGRAR